MNHEHEQKATSKGRSNRTAAQSEYEPPGIEEAWPMDRTKPMIAGRRYKRPTMSSHHRPYVPSRKSEEPGDAKEMMWVFEGRRTYLKQNPPQETFEEIEEDSRSLWTVLTDFPGLREYIAETKEIRENSLKRLQLLNETRRELAKATKALEAELGAQPDIRARQRELAIKTVWQNIKATGEATVEDLMIIYGFETRQGVTKHLRQMVKNGEIPSSKARTYRGEELKKIHAKLSLSQRSTRGRVKKNAT